MRMLSACGAYGVTKHASLSQSYLSLSVSYLGMLFHEDRKIKHAVQACFSKACASMGSIFSRYYHPQCANSVQLLVRLQQAILQPCASHSCEVWAPADAASLCSTPSFAVPAVSRAASPSISSLRSFL